MTSQAEIERAVGIDAGLAAAMNAPEDQRLPAADRVRELLWLQVQHVDAAGMGLLRAAVQELRNQLQVQSINQQIADLEQVLAGTGAHADHTRRQVGRCVYCSCGKRAQGRMVKGNRKESP